MKKLNLQTKKVIFKLKEDIDEIFKSRIISFILFGSALREKNCNDIDIELLLDRPKNNDLFLLHNIICDLPIKVDLLLTYKTELIKNKVFQKKAQGSYFLYSLANGLLLSGKENYYKKLLSETNTDLIKHDLYIKNREYQHSLRGFLLEKDILDKKKNLVKYLLRYICQTLILLNKLSYDELLKLEQKKIIKIIENRNLLDHSKIRFLINLLQEKEIGKKKLIKDSTEILFKFESLNINYISHYHK